MKSIPRKELNNLKTLVYAVVAICVIGFLISGGQVRGLFGEMLILLIVFLIVVELAPQFIVWEEKKEKSPAAEFVP